MRFYFVRHGESEYNEKKIAAGGLIDCPLTLKGITQAHILKKKIASNLGIKKVICSPLLRAKHTAEIIWLSEIQVEENLRELNLGNFTSLPNEECTKLVSEHPRDITIPGGESKQSFQNRVVKVIEENIGNEDQGILFVGHGFTFATLLLYYKLPLRTLDNCDLAMFCLKEDDNKWEIKYY